MRDDGVGEVSSKETIVRGILGHVVSTLCLGFSSFSDHVVNGRPPNRTRMGRKIASTNAEESGWWGRDFVRLCRHVHDNYIAARNTPPEPPPETRSDGEIMRARERWKRV